MKRDILSEVRKHATGGRSRAKLTIFPSEIRYLKSKGFDVNTSKRSANLHSEKHMTECEVSWKEAKLGTKAHTYWMMVQKHRRNSAKHSRDIFRAIDKRLAYEKLLAAIMPDDEDQLLFDEE